VYVAARNQEKATQAIEELKTETDKEAIWLPLDLASLKSVKAAAEEFSRYIERIDFIQSRSHILRSKETQLHILYNNAYACHCLFVIS
jgi:retinol dehydrogenase-12